MSNIDKLNLMRPSPLNGVNRIQAVRPAGAENVRQTDAGNGNNMPLTNSASHLTEAQKKELSQAVKNVSGYVQNITRELNFSVDEELDRTVITVIDEETGDVIRQIPTEDILQLAKNIAQIKDRSSKGILFEGDA